MYKTCFKCGRKKRVDEFDLSGYKVEGGRVFRKCKKCSCKSPRFLQNGKVGIVYSGNWTMPIQFTKTHRQGEM